MTDITPVFNDALRAHNAPPVSSHRYSVDRLDEFLKEAYSINARITELTSYLRAIRPSYLSTASASRHPRRSLGAGVAKDAAQRQLTNNECEAIDAEAKALLRQLSQAFERIQQTEQIRRDTISHLALRKRNKGGLGALGRWAAGGTAPARSDAELEEDSKNDMLAAHRKGVIWFLENNLQEAYNLQTTMMEIRIQREVERSKSVLYKTKAGAGVPYETDAFSNESSGQKDPVTQIPEQQLSQDQLQLFAQENQEMLKHYEDTLSQVRNAEKSLLEISELQSVLVVNLQQQNERIDQLVQDSYLTTENVGKGNKELKRASERPSTARMLFHGTCAFCAFLVVWDLIF